MTFEERKAEILAEQAKAGKREAIRVNTDGARNLLTSISKPETCKHAFDTGEIAFPTAPCRGHRIICQHPQNAGFVSYGRQCQREKCVFFDAE